MTQKEKLLQLFRDNGNMITLGMIMQTNLACEYRKWISIIRKDPLYEIPEPVLDKKNPSNNLYTLIEHNSPTSPTETLEPKCKPTPSEAEYVKRSDTIHDRIVNYKRIQAGYPKTHSQYKAIQEQIDLLEKKLQKQLEVKNARNNN